MGTVATIVTLVSDLLHNVIYSSTRLWNLGRVDLPLVLVMYAIYIIIMILNEAPIWIYAVLGFRFLMFYMAESCDYWIDVLVENIMKTLQTGKLFKWKKCPGFGFRTAGCVRKI